MAVEPVLDHASQAVDSLKTHNFAFVKRSDGSFSSVILAYRSMEPTTGASNGEMEECMTFAVSEGGSMKMVRKRHWNEYVRLVSMEGSCCDPASGTSAMTHFTTQSSTPKRPTASSKEARHKNVVDWVVPRVIAFVPHSDEEYSLISSVSDGNRVRINSDSFRRTMKVVTCEKQKISDDL